MPKRTDIKSILVIGAGPIIIGQACEFDYSGTQAVKALKAEGYRVILVNSNPATIMTDPELADATYVEPITPQVVARIIEQERPDAIIATMGGQTGLNTALALARDGTLKRFGVQLIGADETAIEMAEDRQKFRDAMDEIGLESPRSAVVYNLDEALAALADVGLPAIIRPSFTLGGTGGGIAYNREEFVHIVLGGLAASPAHEVIIDESVLGWKEIEMEVIRDRADNCFIVCSIENVDPMGTHTGDSITIAPAVTLTDKEYQLVRNATFAIMRKIGVATGGANVQFAVDPATGRLVVIEMNPRVSRSSALASKATGFPIAKVTALLAVGYTMDEIQNDMTQATPVSFEPVVDYVVTKVPRFAFEKFRGATDTLGTAMKSVGEVMAIGRSFAESLQKALRGLETGLTGLDEPKRLLNASRGEILAALAQRSPDRLQVAAQALRVGIVPSEVTRVSAFDPWFVEQLANIVAAEEAVRAGGLPKTADEFRTLKAMGFADARLATLVGQTEEDVRAARQALGVRPVMKRIDTCGAEFEGVTPYMYSTYAGTDSEAAPSDRRKIVILGGGPNRIGQGIEFDYCCCHAAFALADAGFETVMVNCNPETVSTDYDTSDRLYFEPLTAEDVLELLHVEQQAGTLEGVILQFGGQTPLKLARRLEAAGIPILGTSPDAIDLAEDRERFAALVSKLGLKQPQGGIAHSRAQAIAVAESIGYPVLMRPSYVLGGRAMEIVESTPNLETYIDQAVEVSGDSPVLIDRYLRDATEVDVDAVADGQQTFILGILEHIEEAGVHSGDSACSLPPYSLSAAVIAELRRQTKLLAEALQVKGLMNVQYAVKDGEVYLIEVNPRASRTVPFISKVQGRPYAKIAARVMAGEPLASLEVEPRAGNRVAVKEAVFPFSRFEGTDPALGPEMKSTGEVMGIDTEFTMAFAKSQLAAGTVLPRAGQVFLSVKDSDKPHILEPAQALAGMGFELVATRGTAQWLQQHGVTVATINKVLEGQPHIVDAISDGRIAMVCNTTEGVQSLKDSATIRMASWERGVPIFTTAAAIGAAVKAIATLQQAEMQVTPLQAHYAA